MVFLRSSKSGSSEGFAPIPSSGELPCERQLHRRYSHGVVFPFSLRFSCCFIFLRSERFYSGQSAHPATNLRISSIPTAGGCPQTQLGTIYGWPLADKELHHPLNAFSVFRCAKERLHDGGCPVGDCLFSRETSLKVQY